MLEEPWCLETCCAARRRAARRVARGESFGAPACRTMRRWGTSWAPVGCTGGLAVLGVLPHRHRPWGSGAGLWELVPAPAAGVVVAAAYTDGCVVSTAATRSLPGRVWPPSWWTCMAGRFGSALAQTAPRAELQAGFLVAKGSAVHVPIVMDCKQAFVAAHCPAEAPHSPAATALLDGPSGDLWRRLAVVLPRVLWVPAHQEVPGRGVSERDWRASRVADEADKAGATAVRLPASARERLAGALAALRVLHDMFARVEVADVAAARGAVQWPGRGPSPLPSASCC